MDRNGLERRSGSSNAIGIIVPFRRDKNYLYFFSLTFHIIILSSECSNFLTNRDRNRNLKTSKALLKAKRTRAPAYSRALRRIKGGFQRGGVKPGFELSNMNWG